jgi:hypothetical protein
MSERQPGQNPIAMWQATWAKEIDEILLYFREFNTIMAWNELINMKTILPPDVEADVEQTFTDTEAIVFKKNLFSSVVTIGAKQASNYRDNTVLPAERKLLTAIKKSLFERGWINKPDFTAQPKFEKKGHL